MKHPRFVGLIFLTPILILATLILLPERPGERAASGATRVVIASAGANSVGARSHSQTTQGPTRVRILSYNIRHGAGMDSVIDLERIAHVISALRPDVVALQEVDSAVKRTDRVDQAAILGELTGMRHVFGAFFDYQGGRYGMALLSKHPILSSENHRLPDGLEPRTALAAKIVPEGSADTLIVVGIHLYATAEERYAQAERLVDLFRDQHLPVVLAGDFNSTPESDVMALFQTWENPDKGDDRLTFPSRGPEREIDYVLYRPADRFQIVEIEVIDEPLASDHRPVLIELELSGPG